MLLILVDKSIITPHKCLGIHISVWHLEKIPTCRLRQCIKDCNGIYTRYLKWFVEYSNAIKSFVLPFVVAF